MSKKKEKFVSRYVIDDQVCKQCGTKVFLMISKTKFKCVLCRSVKTEKRQ
jgi:ribosomal protein S27AE